VYPCWTREAEMYISGVEVRSVLEGSSGGRTEQRRQTKLL
jgi:hypothetical protein